jgi:hypothetical protein
MKRKLNYAGAKPIAAMTMPMLLVLASHSTNVRAEDANAIEPTAVTSTENVAASGIDSGPNPAPAPKLPEPKGAKRLWREYDAWIDPKNKTVIVDGQVSLREGMLEMFACTRNTKEHESIVSANTKAFVVHTALVRLGADPGRPVQFVPKYRPPTGTEVEVTVEWLDESGRRKTARAQDWIKDINTKKAMVHPFVFAGSSFWKDEETGKEFYQAEAGDFICVSNFGTAMLDIPIKSSPENSELAFEAFTERIPPLGAPVRLILRPKLKGKGTASKRQEAKSSADSKSSNADAAKAKVKDAIR